MTSLSAQVASCDLTSVEGEWQRHASARHPERAMTGHSSYTRWGTADGFPILHLGKPTESVVIEAYRHFVAVTIHVGPPLGLGRVSVLE